MSGGFGTIVGFMFSFFVIAFSFVSIFLIFNEQISEQEKVLELSEKEYTEINYDDFDFFNPYYMSGRINFKLENFGDENLFFEDDGEVCFSSFFNEQYVSNNDLFANILNPISSDYSFIERNSYGIFSMRKNVDFISDNIFKFISCGGVSKTYFLESGKQDWWDSDWASRKEILVKNNAAENMADYQLNFEINSSNFDFGEIKEDEMRFIFPLKESLVLDMPFDNYNQLVMDYSKNSNVVTLGMDSGIANDDPLELQNGLIFGALNFEGNDFLKVSSDSSLELDKGITISSWIKWDALGDNFQTIYYNGQRNFLKIINDGGINDNKLLFELEVDGESKQLNSTISLDANWHFVTAVFDGGNMKIYVDGVLDSNVSVIGDINTFSTDNFLGYNGSGDYFTGFMDEFKVFGIPLSDSEIEDLYYNNLRFRELDYYFEDWDYMGEVIDVYVKVPGVLANSNVSIFAYYDNREEVFSNSNFEEVFSYDVPREVGYVVSDITSPIGLEVMSLYDDNEIVIDNNNLLLDEQKSNSIISSNINDSIKMKYLAQVERGVNGGEIIVPISWAGKEFYYRGFRDGSDTFCMLSLWGNANVEIFENGVSEYSGNVDSSGSCVTNDIGTNNNMALISDIPILVSYYGAGGSQDSFVMVPASTEIYGIPSNSLFVAAGPLGANINISDSSGGSSSQSLGAYGTYNSGGNGQDGTAPAYKLVSDFPIGAIAQADSDGTESSVFARKNDFGFKFGSSLDMQYVTAFSLYSDANCSLYDSTGVVDTNIPTGSGGMNGLYKYDVDTGNDNFYLAGNWKFECEKPVWIYYERDSPDADETNLFGHKQMRQYIYPEPEILIS